MARKLHMVWRCGHWVQIEQREKFLAQCLAFTRAPVG